MNQIKLGFEPRRLRIALENILPVRQIKDPQNNVKRYRTIRSSLQEVGLIEPLMVYPQKGAVGKYVLLDGHLRLIALKELGQKDAECLVASENEGFTYNCRVNRLNHIQEHKMILKAVNSGVNPARIAAALSMGVQDVKASLTLLDGVHQEAVDILKDKLIAPRAIKLLRRVSSIRQIEIAELMVSVNNFSAAYAEALVLGTPKEHLVNPEQPKKKVGMSREEIAKMEAEMENLGRDLKAVEEKYGENMLNLTLARSYIKRLLENARVQRFLTANYPEILSEFEQISTVESL